MHKIDPYQPTLIREFYAKMKEKKRGDLRVIETSMKGISIVLTRQLLATIL
jgi:hypothetical protein